MARKLQDRLALAAYKIQNGQEDLSLKDVEARLDATLKRRRALSRLDTSSTCSSSSSEHHSYSNAIASSPIKGAVYSDDIRSTGMPKLSRKRSLYQSNFAPEMDIPNSKRNRSYSMAPPKLAQARSWKSNHNLAQSSPVQTRRDSQFSTSHGPNISFTSDISTIPDSPVLNHQAAEDDDVLVRQSYQSAHSFYQSSPPRTPPPSSHRRTKSGGGEEGADLLLYLATSPSPAHPGAKTSRILAPSTPPSRENGHFTTIQTPSMFSIGTPGQQFNFADFVNVTPSPAQGAFSRTPGLVQTPLGAKEARRRLNYDSLAPPGSPPLSNVGRGSIKGGLGMELGGELQH